MSELLHSPQLRVGSPQLRTRRTSWFTTAIRSAKDRERYTLERTSDQMSPLDKSVLEVRKSKKKALRNTGRSQSPEILKDHRLHPKFSRRQQMLVRSGVARSQQMLVRSEVMPQVFIPNAPAVRFWVVLIGIDEYDGYPLRGCVSDARLIEQYFVDDVGVPRDRIQLLLGSEEHASPNDPLCPSRMHITDTLRGLATNDKIERGDNIVIYYAGHGSCYSYYEDNEDEDEDKTQGYIESLCPIDRDALDANGIRVPDISDREFNTILTLISQHKGNHITAIFDCCHSGGTSFGLPEKGARTAPQTKHATLDDMLLTGHTYLKDYPSYRSILAKDWVRDMDSNVVLAACRDYEFAKAKKVKGGDGVYNGVFTQSLLRSLRSDWKKEGMTYSRLVHRLDKSIHQTPLITGRHKDERIWFQQ